MSYYKVTSGEETVPNRCVSSSLGKTVQHVIATTHLRQVLLQSHPPASHTEPVKKTGPLFGGKSALNIPIYHQMLDCIIK
jgi:hypothetical protein